MTDAMDQVQAFNDANTEDALKRHADRVRAAGRETCANLDCGEPISDFRRQHGAQLCLECQKGEEAQAAHFRAWGQR